MRVFLAGATGFLGRHICKAIQCSGHTVLPHSFSAHGELRELPGSIDLVVNSAGKLGGSGYQDSMLEEANLELPAMLAGECLSRGIPLIHLSTPGVCGLRSGNSETDDYAPVGVYEETKARAEAELLGMLPDVTILRPDFVFGAGDMHKYPLFRQVAKGWFPLVGRGDAKTRPTDAEDVARAVLMAFPGEALHRGVYNIGGPDVLSIREIVSVIAGVLGRSVLTLPVPRLLFKAALKLGPLCPPGLSESRYRLFGTHRFTDTTRAFRAGFTPGSSFRQTAEKAVAWYREKELL